MSELFNLCDVCEITMGQAPAGSSYNERGIGHPLIAGAGDFGKSFPKPKKYTSEPTKLSKVGDIIMCIRATIGDLNWSDNEYCLGRGVVGLRPKSNLNVRYLWHYLNANKNYLLAKGTGSTFKQISRVHIEECKIILPSLDEQERIASILDKVDNILCKRECALNLSNDFLRATFFEMFGDLENNPKNFPIGTIRDLVSSVNYGTSDKASEHSGEYPILRMGNITYQGYLDFTDLKYIDLNEKSKDKFLVRKGDLLFNRTNSKELVGKTAVFENDTEMAFAGYLVRVRPNKFGNNYYISGYLNSLHGKNTLVNMSKSIVGMANINAQELQNIKILIPPKKLQDKYEEIYKAVRNRLELYNENKKELDKLLNTLSYKFFN